jgi:hypothetical protein
MKQAIPAAVLEQHLALLGKTGRGKTNTAKVCVEQVFDEDFRICILDTIKSDWWGLTVSADGTRPGLPFHILGGPRAHLPLSSNTGKAIADLVARGELRHVILDMADFEPGGQMKFFADFAPRLMRRMKGVLYLVIEEAHIIAPKERAGMGAENMAIHWAKVLATAGRKSGIRLIVITQRTQALHNAILGSCDSMIVHGMTAPADMKPVLDWLKANSKDKALNATIEGSLSRLPKGTGWLCSGEAGLFEKREFPLARTFDNTRAPTDDNELIVKTAPVNVEELRKILGLAVTAAEADDPAVLRKRIAELQAQLSKQPQVSPEKLVLAERAGRETAREYFAGKLRQVTQLIDQYSRTVDTELAAVRHRLSVAAATVSAGLENLSKPAGNGSGQPLDVPRTTPALDEDARRILQGGERKAPHRRTVMAPPNEMPDELVKDLERPTGRKAVILSALRWLEDRGITPAPRQTLGGIADFTADKGYGARCLGEMKTAGLIRTSVPGTVELTDIGRKLAPEPPAYATMYEAWHAALSGLHRDILETLSKDHPNALTRDALGARLNKQFEKGYGARVIGELKTMGAIEYPTPKSLRLTRHVMP